MEYLQYQNLKVFRKLVKETSFKPCYKWNTFNTYRIERRTKSFYNVLNLVINGIPSIQLEIPFQDAIQESFKPCYKWNTFNTEVTKPDGTVVKEF